MSSSEARRQHALVSQTPPCSSGGLGTKSGCFQLADQANSALRSPLNSPVKWELELDDLRRPISRLQIPRNGPEAPEPSCQGPGATQLVFMPSPLPAQTSSRKVALKTLLWVSLERGLSFLVSYY